MLLKIIVYAAQWKHTRPNTHFVLLGSPPRRSEGSQRRPTGRLGRSTIVPSELGMTNSLSRSPVIVLYFPLIQLIPSSISVIARLAASTTAGGRPSLRGVDSPSIDLIYGNWAKVRGPSYVISLAQTRFLGDWVRLIGITRGSALFMPHVNTGK